MESGTDEEMHTDGDIGRRKSLISKSSVDSDASKTKISISKGSISSKGTRGSISSKGAIGSISGKRARGSISGKGGATGPPKEGRRQSVDGGSISSRGTNESTGSISGKGARGSISGKGVRGSISGKGGATGPPKEGRRQSVVRGSISSRGTNESIHSKGPRKSVSEGAGTGSARKRKESVTSKDTKGSPEVHEPEKAVATDTPKVEAAVIPPLTTPEYAKSGVNMRLRACLFLLVLLVILGPLIGVLLTRKKASTKGDDTESCANHKCANGAFCLKRNKGGYDCHCAVDFTGVYCDDELESTKSTTTSKTFSTNSYRTDRPESEDESEPYDRNETEVSAPVRETNGTNITSEFILTYDKTIMNLTFAAVVGKQVVEGEVVEADPFLLDSPNGTESAK